MAMADGMSGKQAFSKGQLFYIACIYAAAAIAATVVGVIYWRMVGLM
jgi:hypothetical protein